MTSDVSFSVFNNVCREGIFQTLLNLNKGNKKPIFVCIGSDLVLGDSLGPLIGTMLKNNNLRTYVYGTLNAPITAKEVEYAKHLKSLHPDSVIVSIDAAVGSSEDVGLIRIRNKGLKPGLGVNKNLDEIGEMSIIGVVASKSTENYNLFNLTRLNLVYKMAEVIVGGIADYISHITSERFTLSL